MKPLKGEEIDMRMMLRREAKKLNLSYPLVQAVASATGSDKVRVGDLAECIKSHGLIRGIASYDTPHARLDPELGPFRNQLFVNRVLNSYMSLTVNYE